MTTNILMNCAPKQGVPKPKCRKIFVEHPINQKRCFRLHKHAFLVATPTAWRSLANLAYLGNLFASL